MIRILHVIGSMNMGGAETILMNLYRKIDKSIFQFDFAIHTSKESLYEKEIVSLGGHIYRFKPFNGLNFYEYRHQWDIFFDNHKEFSLVHGHIGSCAPIYLKSARKHGLLTIAHSHSANKNKLYKFRDIVWNIYSYPTRNIADFFLGCSFDAVKCRFGKKIINSNRYSVLNNGIDPNIFRYNEEYRNQIRKEFGIPDGFFVVGHIGRIVQQKNHPFLIDVFNAYHNINKQSCCLIVGDGPLKNDIIKKVQKLNLSNCVFFAGLREDPYKFLSAFDCMVFPSFSEGLGISVIEAQASGLNVFCSDSLPKEAKVSDHIFFVSLKEKAESWASLINNSSYSINRNQCFLNISKYRYDINSSVDTLVKVYKHLIKQKNI